VKWLAGVTNPLMAAAVVLGAYGVVYLGVTIGIGVPEARATLRRLRRRSTEGRTGGAQA
jgi:hypothetical protein